MGIGVGGNRGGFAIFAELVSNVSNRLVMSFRRGFAVIVSILILFNVMKAESLYLKVNGRTLTVDMPDNVATRALVAMLAEGDITVSMHDYGGWEKVGSLPKSLPSADRQMTAVAGDVMLYQSRDIVIFYGNNFWAYTPLGHIEGVNAQSLKTILGNGNVEVTLSLSDTSGIAEIPVTDLPAQTVVSDLNGRPVNTRPLPPGLYIINGEKRLVK